jgi:hypothetical protein
VIGESSYLPSEALAGRALDARADLYAVGIILYEMIAAQTPFPSGRFAEDHKMPPAADHRANLPADLAAIEAAAHVLAAWDQERRPPDAEEAIVVVAGAVGVLDAVRSRRDRIAAVRALRGDGEVAHALPDDNTQRAESGPAQLRALRAGADVSTRPTLIIRAKGGRR